jgi:hypothetical protein
LVGFSGHGLSVARRGSRKLKEEIK